MKFVFERVVNIVRKVENAEYGECENAAARFWLLHAVLSHIYWIQYWSGFQTVYIHVHVNWVSRFFCISAVLRLVFS